MSTDSINREIFTAKVTKLVVEVQGHLDGLSVANVLQHAATKAMKKCLGGDGDARDQACFDMLDQAKRELIENMPAARERMRRWRARVDEKMPDLLRAFSGNVAL